MNELWTCTGMTLIFKKANGIIHWMERKIELWKGLHKNITCV